MSKTLTARLDKKSQIQLFKLSKALGKTESQIVRDGIHLMAINFLSVSNKKPRFLGLGQFASEYNDLASNKKHLDGFGQ